MLAQIHYLAKMNSNNNLAVPVSRYLASQTITQPRDEHRNHLRLRLHDQLTHTRLRAQERIRIVALVACSFGMKPDDVACPGARQIGEHFKRELIKCALLRNRMI